MVTREQALKAYHKIIDKEFFGDECYLKQRLKYAQLTIKNLSDNGEFGFANALTQKIVESDKKQMARDSFKCYLATKIKANVRLKKPPFNYNHC